ncbi:T9SS type A sorting domain-containing protein [uncultured Winogradskyella sp.]|uniref:beta strand repeat-containing protein n=1 Tax=uncultured Winogradskyella sp. TaxID=395353 RepID=UPI0030EE1850
MRKFYAFLLLLLIGNFGFGQTTIFSESGGGSEPTDWIFQNNVTSNTIDKGSYWLVDAGSPSDFITTATYDLSSYTDAEFTLDVASFNSGSYNPAKIEISFDGGSNYTQTETSSTTIGSSYIDGGTFILNSVSSQVVIRISNNGTSGRGVRLRNLKLIASGVASTCTEPITAATGYNSTLIESNSATINWTRGDGDNVLVLMKEGSAVDASPVNGTAYAANTAFSLGDEIGTGNFVVYNGTAITESITALTENTNYHVAIYEYNNTDTCYISSVEIGNFTTLANTRVQFTAASASVSEGIGTYNLEFSISDEDATIDTTFDIALVTGDPTDIDNYTTQSVIFLSGTNTNQTVAITVTDDAIFETNETLVFTIQNVAGGNNATVGGINTFDLTITNNDTAPPITLPYNEDFSNCSAAEWTPFDEAGDDSWLCSGGEYAINGFTGSDDLDWLISDFTIDFDAYNSVLIDVTTREQYGNTLNEAGEFELRYSTNYSGSGDPTLATWTALTFDPENNSSGNGLSTPSTYTINASGITGIAYLAFFYDMTAGSGAEDWRITEVSIEETTDVDSEADDSGSQPATTTISSLADTQAEAIEVFNMDLYDFGTSDGLNTNVTKIRLYPHSTNTADWTDNIQGVTVSDGSPITVTSVTIDDAFIDINFTSGDLTILDSDISSLSISVYLNTSNITDVGILSFMVDVDNHGFEADSSGSTFTSTFSGSDFNSNDFTLSVDVTELVFTQQPPLTVDINTTMPSVIVQAQDENGNVDIDYNLDVDITSSGTLSASPITETSVSGVATFTTITHTELGTDLILTADDGLLTVINSTNFDVIALPEFGWQITAENTEFVIDFDNTVLNVNEGQFNGSGIVPSPSAGQLNSNAWATTGMSDGNTDFGDSDTSGDYARGSDSGGVNSGGFYAFEVNSGNYGFGAQPTGSDWTPGDIVLKSQNKTTQVVTSVLVEYTVYVYNNAGRSTAIDFYYGEDENLATYNYVAGLDVITSEVADASPIWVAEQRSTTITGLSITENNFFYLNWYGYDNGGSGSRDEFAIDDIKITFNPPTTYTYNGIWSPSDPNGASLSTEAIIIESGNTSISTNTDINTITISPGAGLTIDSGATLTAINGITLESNATSYSSLILDGTIAGNVVYKRHVNTFNNTTGSTNGQNDLISPPVTNASQDFGAFRGINTNIPSGTVGGGTTTFYLFGPYDNNANSYTLFSDADDATVLTAGAGYRAASTDTSTFTFMGAVLSETVPVTITTGSENAWNLIGNPYPSYINSTEFLTSNVSNLDQDAVAIYGYDGDALNGWTVINLNNPENITPGQGFMVLADAPSADLNFTPTMRRVSGGDDFISGRTENTNAHFSLKIENNNTKYSTDFYFNNNSTRGLDEGYDATIFTSQLPDLYMYSHLVENNTGRKMTMQSLGETDLTDVTIPLGVNSNQLEQITFSIDESTLPNTVDVYLEDNVENTFTLLTSGDYTLTPNENLSGTGRFYLRFTTTALSIAETTLDNLNIYSNPSDKTIVVTGQLLETTTANLYDLQGRLVNSSLLLNTDRSHSIDVSNLSIGVYVVELINGTQNKTQKVILR